MTLPPSSSIASTSQTPLSSSFSTCTLPRLSREQRGQVGRPKDDGYLSETGGVSSEDLTANETPATTPASSSSSGGGRGSILPGQSGRYLSSHYNQTRVRPYKLYCSTERRNTILTLTDPDGNPLHRTSAGQVGFAKSQRKGVEPGIRAAFAMFEAIRDNEKKYYEKCKTTFTQCEMIFKGLGPGREGIQKALMTAEGARVRRTITQVSDATRIKIGGVRPKKRMIR
ncbi:unnamed protein product [Sympodiomycopsis kandeliae]